MRSRSSEAKETLIVERDFARLKVRELDQELKSKSESIDILSARCSLLEQERNKYASNSATADVHVTLLSTARDSEHPPVHLEPSRTSSSPLESLINLEVLKAIKEHTNTANKDTPKDDPSKENKMILEKVNEISSKIEIIIENEKFLNNKLSTINISIAEVQRIT